jgi:hypothetical protein
MLRTLVVGTALALAACGGSQPYTRTQAGISNTPAKDIPGADAGTTERSAKMGVFEAPGSSGDVSGTPGYPGD